MPLSYGLDPPPGVSGDPDAVMALDDIEPLDNINLSKETQRHAAVSLGTLWNELAIISVNFLELKTRILARVLVVSTFTLSKSAMDKGHPLS